MNLEKINVSLSGERYMYAIQKIESENVGRTLSEGYAPARWGGGGSLDRYGDIRLLDSWEATTK